MFSRTLPQVSWWWRVVIVSTALLPVAAGVAALLARWRGWRNALTEVGMVVGTLPWLWLTLTPQPVRADVRYLWLVPFADVAHLVAEDPAFAVFQVVGNLAVFAAFGFLAPIRWGWRPGRVLLVAAAGSVVIETLQLVLSLGRVTSIDDVILNAAGAGLAALVAREWLSRARRGPGPVVWR